MKRNLLLGIFLFPFIVYGQVGINNTAPTSTLDITAENATGNSTNVDGLLIPRVDRQRAQSMTSIPISTLIYVNSIATGTTTGNAANIDTVGYYYYNGTVWTKLNPSASNVNIYTSDGTLQGNRVVTQEDKTLAFTATASNAFSVDGSTFSVDAANDRVGIGTSVPQNKLDLGSAGGSTTKDVAGKKLAVYNNATGTDFYGLGLNPGTLQFHAASTEDEEPGMVLNSAGNVGIGTSIPSPSALVEMTSISKGLLTPRMTTAQRDAINPKPEGLIIYNLDVHCLQYWNATEWTGNCDNNSGVGTITSLNCSGATNNGTLTSGTSASGVSSVISYTGGNGGSHNGQTVSSTGVTGLTATLSSGSFANGNGTLTYSITGTPASSGTANFAINIGGQTCTLTRTVASGIGVATITSCTSGTLSGTYQAGTAMNSSNTVVLPVNITQLGPWSASSNTVNGISFSGSGNFTTLGNQNITLTASGTPANNASFSYIFTLGTSTCNRSITFVESLAPCSDLYGVNSLPGNFAIGSHNVNVSLIEGGSVTLGSQTNCGVTTNGSAFVSGDGPIVKTTFHFDRPVTNVQFLFTAMNPSQILTFTAKNGATTVAPTLTKSNSSCLGNILISGNQLTANTTSVGGTVTIGGGVYFTDITITHNTGTNQVTLFNLLICNALSQ